jgi:glutathionylspermidine synthase
MTTRGDGGAVAPGAVVPGAVAPATGTAPAPTAGAVWGLCARPWPHDAAERARVVRALRFEHFKWDSFSAGRFTLLPELLVVPEALHRRVVRTVERLSAGLARFEARVRREPEALARLGIPAALHPLIAEEPDRPHQCARYDLFPCDDGRLMVSEFNEDVPGGFNEAEGLPELLGDPGTGCRWEKGPRARFLDAFAGADRVALLYATAFSEDLQHMLILEKWLAAAGHPVVLASPAHLQRRLLGGARVLDRAVDAAFRFYPGEWMPRLPNFGTWRRVGPRLPMMNPLRHMVRQSKKVFDLWHEDAASAEERDLLAAHCPRTHPFDPARLGRLREERERWVLKRAFGRMGDAVVMGSLSTPARWEQALAEAARNPIEWCVQERFSVLPLEFQAGPLYPTLGAYVVNGRFAGYYSRADARPFLTHEALHVATVVQAA